MKSTTVAAKALVCFMMTAGASAAAGQWAEGMFRKAVETGERPCRITVGSERLIDSITSGEEDFGKLDFAMSLDAGGVKKEVVGFKVVSTRRKQAIGFDVFEIDARLDSKDAECEAKFTVSVGSGAILVSLDAIRLLRGAGRASFRFNSIAPFFALSAEEYDRRADTPPRGAWSALDGRWIGVIAPDAVFDYDVPEKGPRRGVLDFPVKLKCDSGHTPVKGVSAVYLLGVDGRPGWRERTGRLLGIARTAPVRRVVRETGGTNVLSGAKLLDAGRFRLAGGGFAKGVLEYDLSGFDMPFFDPATGKDKEYSTINEHRDEGLPLPLLVIDGELMKVSSWPNGGRWAFFAEYMDEALTFRYDGDRPNRWLKAPEVLLHGFWSYNWYDSIIPAGKIDTVKRTIKLAVNPKLGMADCHPSGGRWKAVNLVEEIDMPGEYAVDRKARKLYLMPPKGFSKSSRVELACGGGALMEKDSLRDVEFTGMVFENSCGNGVVLRNCENVVFSNCTFRNIRRIALKLENCRNCTVTDCKVENIGNGGVWVSGGDRRTLARGDNLIEKCLFRNFGIRMENFSYPIVLSGVGNTVRGNTICDGSDIVARFFGNDMLFERNIVSNVCRSVDDAGALYQGYNASARGNVMRENLWIDVASGLGHGVSAVYFDDGDAGNLIVHDRFVRCGDPGRGNFGTVMSHGGFDNVVRECTFVDCDRPFGSMPWSEEKWHSYVFSPGQMNCFTNLVDVRSRAYRLSYPELKTWFDPDGPERRVNISIGCVLDGVPLHRTTRLVREYRPGVTMGAWKHFDLRMKKESRLRQMSVYDRTRLSARRLEAGEYGPKGVFKSEEASGGWPGDTEGRTILALVLQERALGVKSRHLDAIIAALPSHLNEKGYFGPVREGVFDEQQFSGNGWVLRGLTEYCADHPESQMREVVRRLARNLFLPALGSFGEYPVSPEDRAQIGGGASGRIVGSVGKWRLSSDIGCIFIGFDGLVDAYLLTKDEDLRRAVEEIAALVPRIDFKAVRAQTHATLTAARALMRYDAKRFLPLVVSIFQTYVESGMTDWYENYNWFGREDTWTEPCAIVDSLILAHELKKATGHVSYEKYERLFLKALLSHQRENGGFGLKRTFPSGTRRPSEDSVYEASWCCTMRGAAGLARCILWERETY